MVVAGPGGVAAGGGGGADLRVMRRDPFSRVLSLIVRVTNFSSMAASLGNVAGGGVCLAALLRCMIRAVRVLINSRFSLRKASRLLLASEMDMEDSGLLAMAIGASSSSVSVITTLF